MANIAIVTLIVSHGTVTNTKAMLESLGHTVSVILSSNATFATLVTFDLIVSVRGADDATYSSVIASAVMAGTPLICGFPGVTTASNTPFHSLKLITGSLASSSEVTESAVRVRVAHPYTDGLAPIGGSIPVYPSTTFAVAIATSQVSPNLTILADKPTDSSRFSMLLAKKGVLNIDSVALGANVAYYSFCYGLNGYTGNAKTIFERTINDFTLPKKLISGNVVDSNGSPAQRKVYAVNLTTNNVDGHTLSDVSGNYSLQLPDNTQHAIFCVDDVAAPLILVG
ncbi:hypothetical protein ACQKC5_03910 [Shewanella baltica]|uniref:hypothetical protein n=1 Tax=Shewanella baltica TaxID=62322 RepID=UPI003D019D64